MGRPVKLSLKRRKQLRDANSSKIAIYSSKAVEKAQECKETRREFAFTQQKIFETNEKIIEKVVQLPVINSMLFVFAVLVSGSSFTRAEEMFSYVSEDFPAKSAFYECQK